MATELKWVTPLTSAGNLFYHFLNRDCKLIHWPSFNSKPVIIVVYLFLETLVFFFSGCLLIHHVWVTTSCKLLSKLLIPGWLCGHGWSPDVLHWLQLQFPIPGRCSAWSEDPGPSSVSALPLLGATSLPLTLLHWPLQDNLPISQLQLSGELKRTFSPLVSGPKIKTTHHNRW